MEAEDAYSQNKSPENYKRLEDAYNAYNKAHMAELNAWANAGGRGFPPKDVISAPTPAEPVQPAEQEGPPSPTSTPQPMANAGAAKSANQPAPNQTQLMPESPAAQMIKQQTQDAMDARKAEVDALTKYYGNPTAENKAAYQEAAGQSRDATNREEQAWWQNGGKGVPPGTRNQAPMPLPPKDWTPGKVIDGELPQEKSPVGPNATMAMGLGALTSTIQTGP
jgi:hypothetical protein